jgi:hypothetical protein
MDDRQPGIKVVEAGIQGCSKVAAKALAAGKFSGFLPKAATTLERPWRGFQIAFGACKRSRPCQISGYEEPTRTFPFQRQHPKRGIIHAFRNAWACVGVPTSNQSPNRSRGSKQRSMETQPRGGNFPFYKRFQSKGVPQGTKAVISDRLEKNQSRRKEKSPVEPRPRQRKPVGL